MTITAETVALVHARSGGYCEACTRMLPVEGGQLHHRQLRKQGGSDEAINLMEVHMVCHNGHAYSIHGCPKRSKRLGHIVPEWDDPAVVEVIAAPDLFKLRR